VSAINQLKALIVGAPEELRAELRRLASRQQIARCAALRDRPARSLEHRTTVRALRSTAHRIQLLAAEAAELRAELEQLVAAVAPRLLELPASARSAPPRSWSAGRTPGGCARRPPSLRWPAPTPSQPRQEQVTRPRLNRGGDRQLNRALHTIVLARLRDDPQTRAYAARRRGEGKSIREIRRCLNRAVVGQLFKLLERYDRSTVELLQVG
jgi:transposase